MSLPKIKSSAVNFLLTRFLLESKLKKRVFNQLGFALFGLFFSFGVIASNLPVELKNTFFKAHIPLKDVALWVAPAGSSTEIFSHNAQKLMQPASCVKLVTTLAALELLGPDYRWKTEWRADSFDAKTGLVRGLSFIGGGDPHYVIERLWLAAQRLKSMGVRSIVGDIGVARSLFAVKAEARPIDGQKDRAYNVEADAALVSQRSVCIEIVPDKKEGIARLVTIPRLSGFKVTPMVKLTEEPCSNWKESLKARITNEAATMKGTFPARCGKKIWPVALWKADAYLKQVFESVFSEVGIQWKGAITEKTYGGSRLLLEEESNPLAELVTLTNKFSNNAMARHLFLSLSFADALGTTSPASLKRSQDVLSQWLTKIGLEASQIFVENGSGLSRKTHISAAELGKLISYGVKSTYGPEFLASLPIAGVDGTMRKRGLTGFARIKTGRIQGVRAAAGLVRDVNGHDWIVVLIINSTGQAIKESLPAIDATLRWVGSGVLTR